MDNSVDANIERMTSFIQLEAQEKANEIKIKAIEDYNTEKAKLVRLETVELENSFKQKQKEIEIDFVTKKSEIKNNFNMKFQKEKFNILNNFFVDLKKECKNKKLSKILIEQCVKEFEDENDFVVYCLKNDRKIVDELLKSKIVAVKDLDERMLGGIIFVTKDGKKKCDNSFLNRCETIFNNYLNEITKVIFNGEN